MKGQRSPLSVWAAFSLVVLVLLGCTPAAPAAIEPAATDFADVAAMSGAAANPTSLPTSIVAAQPAASDEPVGVLPINLLPIPFPTSLPAPTITAQPQPCSVAARLDGDTVMLMNSVSRQNLIDSVAALESFGSRHTLSSTQSATAGIGAARNWLYNEFDRVGNGRLEVSFDDFPVLFGGVTTNQQNVVAVLPGLSAHAGMVVLMAHYDSRTLDMADGLSLAPGANDNATGVSVLLEVARLLSSREWNQTVMFVAFAAEEQGTQGSHHFVQQRLGNGATFDAALNNDMVGGRPGIPQNVRLFSAGPDTSPDRQLARYVDFVGQLYLPTFDVVLQDAIDRDGRYSDHREFTNAAIPAARLIESQEDSTVQHSNLDTFDRVDYSYLFQVTQLNLATVANMIGAPAAPAMPTVTPVNNAGTFRISWPSEANTEQTAGYAISVRPAGSAELPALHYVCANQAGEVELSNFDPQTSYAVSVAAVDGNGRIGLFTSETMITCACQ